MAADRLESAQADRTQINVHQADDVDSEVNSSSETGTWPTDSTVVDATRENEMLFWAKRFRVSIGMLRQTVRSVGSRFGDVAAFLKRRRSG